MIKYTARNQMQDFCLPRHYEYSCRKVGNNGSDSETSTILFSLLKLFQLATGLLELNETFLAPFM